jgi:hypothetical protein
MAQNIQADLPNNFEKPQPYNVNYQNNSLQNFE